MHPADHPGPSGRVPDLQHDAGPEAAEAAAPGGRRRRGRPRPRVAGLAAVDLTPERIQLIGMRTATVKREALGGELRDDRRRSRAERARAGADQHALRGLGAEAAGVRDGRTRAPGPGAGDDLQPRRPARPAGVAHRARLGSARRRSRPARARRTGADLAEDARRRLELLGHRGPGDRRGRADAARPARPIDDPLAGRRLRDREERRRGALAVQPGDGAVRGRRPVAGLGDRRDLRAGLSRIHVGQKAARWS